jgi:hypothetical protein
MKCEEIESMMVDYLDMVLEDSQKAVVEKHLETCERCLDQVRDYREMLDKVNPDKFELPDENLRINFYHMLHQEIGKLGMENDKPLNRPRFVSGIPAPFRIAAGVALFLAGSLAGALIFQHTGKRNAELADMKIEMQNMKEMVMLSMLKEESPSQRIQAVSYTDDLMEPDSKVLNALATTLNNDRNVNVRIAAAYSLARFSGRQQVRDTLVASLGKQTEPIIQVILMNILVEMKESKAVRPMQLIMSDDKSLKEVREVAEKGISLLL